MLKEVHLKLGRTGTKWDLQMLEGRRSEGKRIRRGRKSAKGPLLGGGGLQAVAEHKTGCGLNSECQNGTGKPVMYSLYGDHFYLRIK